jgi:hypothetical protein
MPVSTSRMRGIVGTIGRTVAQEREPWRTAALSGAGATSS